MATLPMTGQQIIDSFSEITGESIDGTQALILLNMTKNEYEASRDWNFLRAFNSSLSASPSDTYLTMKSLPSDFLMPRELYINAENTPYSIIPFEARERYRDNYKKYYIDWKNSQFALCGKVSSTKTINLYYTASTDDIGLTTSPTWLAIFHPLIAFLMADKYMAGQDGDEINFRMSPENRRIGDGLRKTMTAWDSRIGVLEYNAKNATHSDLSSYPDIIDL